MTFAAPRRPTNPRDCTIPCSLATATLGTPGAGAVPHPVRDKSDAFCRAAARRDCMTTRSWLIDRPWLTAPGIVAIFCLSAEDFVARDDAATLASRVQ